MDYFDGPFVLVPTQTFVTRVVAYRRFGSMDTLMMVCFLFTAAVREKLMVDRDSEISATSLRVSLLCPVQSLYFILKRGKEEEGWRKEGRRKGGGGRRKGEGGRRKGEGERRKGEGGRGKGEGGRGKEEG